MSAIRCFRKEAWRCFFEKLVRPHEAQSFVFKRWVALAIFLVCLALNVHVRFYPAYFPALKKVAVANALAGLSDKYSSEFQGPQNEKVLSVLRRVGDAIREDPKAFNARVVEEYQKLKDPFQDENGLTYLSEFDPYTWARWTANIVKKGYPGDIFKNGKSYDTMLLAPLEVEVFHYKLLFYATAFLYRGVHGIWENVSLSRFIFFIPVFYAVCFLALFFVFVRAWSNSWAAFLAVFSTGFMPMFLMRGSAGWYDFDMLSPLMALLVACALMEALKTGKRLARCAFFALVAALLEGCYALVWMGWWFMLIVVAGFFLIAIARGFFPDFKLTRERVNRVRPYIVCACIFLIFSPLAAHVLAGVNVVERFLFLKDFLRFDTLFSKDIWPNTNFTVDEVMPLSLRAIADHFYGPWLFALALFAVLIVTVREWRTERRDMTLLMFCWFLFMFVASLQANRFVIYLAVPAFLFLGVFIGEYILKFIQKRMAGFWWAGGVLIYLVLISLILSTVFRSGAFQTQALRPAMNDAWHDALVFVDKNTSKDAVINSWWDYGSWFPYYGKRKVLFDGQFQYTQLAYWMARVLLEQDEEKAIRILRLLNNASYRTYEKLLERIPDPFQCEAFLEALLTAQEDEARRLLRERGFSGNETEETIKALFAQPSAAYFLVDESLLGKMPSISMLGKWDFQKLYAYRKRKEPQSDTVLGLQRVYGASSENAERIVRDLSSRSEREGVGALSRSFSVYSPVALGSSEGELVHFGNGFVFNPRTGDGLLYSQDQGGFKVPEKTVFFENDQMRIMGSGRGNDSRAVLLTRQGGVYKSLVADPDLVGSLAVKLLFLEGAGLQHFKLFYSDEKNHIYIYKINWSAE